MKGYKDVKKYFKLKERNTDVRTEIIAGITTFLSMVYILAVNPALLEAGGMDKASVFTATAIAGAATRIPSAGGLPNRASRARGRWLSPRYSARGSFSC